MNRAKVLFIIDFFLALSFLLNAGTGLLKYFGLFGTKIRDYILLHDLSGVLFVILGITHLVMHWQWIKCVFKSFFKDEGRKR